jgi:hypothetical protein
MNKAVIFILLIPYWVFSQDPSQSDQTNLCKYIILAQSIQPTNQDSLIKRLLSENEVTESRYAEIIRTGFEGKPLNLKDNEKKLKISIQVANLEAKIENEKRLDIFLSDIGWSKEKLNEMLKKYNDNQTFREVIHKNIITLNNK